MDGGRNATRGAFALGVASGEPRADGFVIWTRLVRRDDEPLPSPVVVEWQVARDPSFTDVVRYGRTTAVPEWAHSVHVRVVGLTAARHYWYRFRTEGETSTVGRAITLPDPAAATERVAFAVVSCQHFESGWFHAYRHIAGEDVTFVLHLGDYIYEGPPGPPAVRAHTGAEAITLDEYRRRYALYKRDPDLQAAHAAHPFVVSVDDHEVSNDWAGETDAVGSPREVFLARRGAAFRAFYEHMPLDPSRRPVGPDMPLYRRLGIGNVVTVHLLDTRQYRTDQPCAPGFPSTPDCPERYDERATMLGTEQEAWLTEGLQHDRNAWQVVAQQVLVAPFDYGTPGRSEFNTDQWDGYPAARERLLAAVAARAGDVVVLSGDYHTSWVNELALGDRVVAAEFLGPSLTSTATWASTVATALPRNPHVRWFEGTSRGYLRCTATADEFRADFRFVDATARAAPAVDGGSWCLARGDPLPRHVQ